MVAFTDAFESHTKCIQCGEPCRDKPPCCRSCLVKAVADLTFEMEDLGVTVSFYRDMITGMISKLKRDVDCDVQEFMACVIKDHPMASMHPSVAEALRILVEQLLRYTESKKGEAA